MKNGALLRFLAVAEAVTLLALVFVAVPIKYLGDYPQIVRVMGPVHGVTFVAFCWAVLRAWSEGLVTSRMVVRLLIGACIPFGGIVNERWLKNRRDGAGA